MNTISFDDRYSIIEEKNKREIVLLKGKGCFWKKCRFCDYHLDASKNEHENFILNKAVLSLVTGKYHILEVINSGSVFELDDLTMEEILKICVKNHISQIHFESHWAFREKIYALREKFSKFNIKIKMKIGVETFDEEYRENIMVKGMKNATPKEVSKYFDEVCLLFGLVGQTVASMENDIITALNYFERVCINIMCLNEAPLKPNNDVIKQFIEHLYPKYIKNDRIDILINNTDFGVGGEKNDQ